MRWTNLAGVGLCAAACMGGTPALATAGEYHVYSCRTPSGAVAPTDGWTSSVSGVADVVEDGCKTGGALVAALEEGAAHEVNDRATWEFVSPVELEVKAARLSRAADVAGGWSTNATYEAWIAGPNNDDKAEDIVNECVAEFGCPTGVGDADEPASQSNLITVLPENLGAGLYANASCGGTTKFSCPSGKGDPNGYAAVIYLYAADLTLEQSSQPAVSNVGGELADAATLSGTADLSFEAADPGSGVYQAVFAVDGTEVGRTLIDENGGRCRDVGETSDGLPAFLYLEPCAPALSADVPFDTTTLADGTHHLVVSVTDAAGNATVALDRKIDVLNHPALPGSGNQAPPGSPASPVVSLPPPLAQGEVAANGSHASAAAALAARWASTTHSALTASYGKSHTVTGRLLAPGGAPIAGATVQALFRPAAQGGVPRALGGVHTAADGSFRLELPASTPSGQLTLAYGSRSGQPAPDVTATLTLSVPASLSLRVSPRVSRAGGTIHFAGTLRGGPLPAGGKQLVLEASAPGGPWRQFQVLSTHARGRFQASYRFRLPGPVVYRFRVDCPHEADFPFARGDSNLVSVDER